MSSQHTLTRKVVPLRRSLRLLQSKAQHNDGTPILSLPVELRYILYGHLLRSSLDPLPQRQSTIIVAKTTGTQRTTVPGFHRKQLNISEVCRRFYLEYQDFYWRLSTIRLRSLDALRTFIKNDVTNAESTNINNLTKVQLLSAPNMNFQRLAEALKVLLKAAKLQHIEVVHHAQVNCTCQTCRRIKACFDEKHQPHRPQGP